MKNASLILLFIIPISVFSQWRYVQKNDAFEGIYRYSKVVGKGYDRTYDDPTLILRKYEKENSYDLYINDAGYFTTNSINTILIKFDDEDIFYVTKGTPSIDRDAIFIDRTIYKEEYGSIQISRTQLLQKMMEGSKLTVRIKTDYDTYDMRFTLSGSTKAINYVLPDIDEEILKLKEKEEKRIKAELEAKRISDLILKEKKEQFEKNIFKIKNYLDDECNEFSSKIDMNYLFNDNLEYSVMSLLENNEVEVLDLEILNNIKISESIFGYSTNNPCIRLKVFDYLYFFDGILEFQSSDYPNLKSLDCISLNSYILQPYTNGMIFEFKIDTSFKFNNNNGYYNDDKIDKWTFTSNDEVLSISNIEKDYLNIYNKNNFLKKKYSNINEYYSSKLLSQLKNQRKKGIKLTSNDHDLIKHTITYEDNSSVVEVFLFIIDDEMFEYLNDSRRFMMIEYKYSKDLDTERKNNVKSQILNSFKLKTN